MVPRSFHVNSPETGIGVAGFPTEGTGGILCEAGSGCVADYLTWTGTGVAGFPTEGTGGILCEAGSGCVAG